MFKTTIPVALTASFVDFKESIILLIDSSSSFSFDGSFFCKWASNEDELLLYVSGFPGGRS